MTTCCVVSCRNRYSPGKRLKFYRIPSGRQPFQLNRGALWQQAIQRANDSSELTGNIRICGAHFISGKASMDINNVDFVPTVFRTTKQSPKKKPEKKHCRKSIAGELEVNVSKESDLSVSMETDESSSESEAPSERLTQEEGETPVESAEAKATLLLKTIKIPASCPSLDKMAPVVLLKPLDLHREFLQRHREEESGVCDVCGVQYTNKSQHQCPPDEEPSFPCNVCDRSFATVQSLKRHKLLHVRDKRKCGTCGVLFCRRHSSVFSQAVAKPPPHHSSDDSSDEEEEEEAAKTPYHLTTTTALPTPQYKSTVQPSVTMKETLPKPNTTMGTPQSNMTEQPSLTMSETLPKPNTTMGTPQSIMTEQPSLTMSETLPKPNTTMGTPQSIMTEQPSLTMSETLPTPQSSEETPNTTTMLTPPAAAATTTVPTPPANTPAFTLPAPTTVPTLPADTTLPDSLTTASVMMLTLPASSTLPTTSADAAGPGPFFLVPVFECTTTASSSTATGESVQKTLIGKPVFISFNPFGNSDSPRVCDSPKPALSPAPAAAAAAAPAAAPAAATSGPRPLKSPSMQPGVQVKSEQFPRIYTSMKFFSPGCLTSAFLKVERRYTYAPSTIDHGVEQAKREKVIKLPPAPPAIEIKKQEETERIAYDLDIVI